MQQKLEIVPRLEAVLQGAVKPSASHLFWILVSPSTSSPAVITQCCIHELYLQGKEQQPATDLAKTFERRKCNHREAIPGDECVSSVVGMCITTFACY